MRTASYMRATLSVRIGKYDSSTEVRTSMMLRVPRSLLRTLSTLTWLLATSSSVIRRSEAAIESLTLCGSGLRAVVLWIVARSSVMMTNMYLIVLISV